MKASIELVFQAIENERKYQDQKWATEQGLVERTPLEWLSYIESYVDAAKEVLSRQTDDVAVPCALHSLRKIAALSVAAIQQNGVLTRATEGPRPVGAVGVPKAARSEEPRPVGDTRKKS